MDGKYRTIEDIATDLQITSQAIYKKRQQDPVLSNLMETDRKKAKRTFYYGETVYKHLRDYYKPDYTGNDPAPSFSGEQNEGTSRNEPPVSPAPEETPEAAESETASLRAAVSTLQQQIQRLEREAAEAKAEKQELLRQNGQLLLLLQQEKDEKRLYLPAPKGPGFFERLFGRK